MELLKKRILEDGSVIGSDILKVDGFLNHTVDPFLLKEIGKEFACRYKNDEISLILTIESSGIAIAAFAAYELGVPLVFAKKYSSSNLDKSVYCADVYSFTKETTFNIRVSQNAIKSCDKVLIIDDFLAKGGALKGLIEIVNAAKAQLVGCGIVIEKSFQNGGDELRKNGVRIESLARIESLNNGAINFL